MSLFDELNTRLVAAQKAKDTGTLSVLRMVKAKILEKKTEKGFSGELTDEVVLAVVVAYHKSLKKAYDDFAGYDADQVADKLEALSSEMAVLDPYLPKLLDEAATEALVEAAIAATAATQPGHVGKVMGFVMKDHKGSVDPGLVKAIAAKKLNPS